MAERRMRRWGWVVPLLVIMFVWNVITDDDDEPEVARPAAVEIQPVLTEQPRTAPTPQMAIPAQPAVLYVPPTRST